jgi:hypothetical protein
MPFHFNIIGWGPNGSSPKHHSVSQQTVCLVPSLGYPNTQRAAPPPSGENMPKTFDSTSPAKCENLAFVVPLRLLCELAPTCRPPALSRTFPAARFAFWTAPPEHKPLFNMATEQRTLSASCNSACKSDINASRQVSRHRRLASALPISPSRLSPM